MCIIKGLVQKMNKTMKGTSESSILERSSYAKVSKTDRGSSGRSVLELASYGHTKAGNSLWGRINKEIEKKNLG